MTAPDPAARPPAAEGADLIAEIAATSCADATLLMAHEWIHAAKKVQAARSASAMPSRGEAERAALHPTVDARAVLADHRPHSWAVSGLVIPYCVACRDEWLGTPEAGGCTARLLAARALLLEGLLREVEWADEQPECGEYEAVDRCPLCKGWQGQGHDPDCRLHAALESPAPPRATGEGDERLMAARRYLDGEIGKEEFAAFFLPQRADRGED